MYHQKKLLSLVGVLLALEMTACGTKVVIPNEPSIEEGKSCADAPKGCLSGLVCYDKVCRKPCSSDEDCDVVSQHCAEAEAICVPGKSVVCGNNKLEDTEECDDGNEVSGDGCSATCQKEAGWNCDKSSPTVCTTICGDGMRVGAELGENGCDDGNYIVTDSCPSGANGTCQKAKCGDGFILAARDGSSDSGEACDDGNEESGDGCSATCTVEHGYSCKDANSDGQLSECACATGFSGSACDSCTDGYFGEDCLPCPGLGSEKGICSGHGTCSMGINGSGLCQCAEGFVGLNCESCGNGRAGDNCECDPAHSGENCAECNDNYFGENCEPCPGLGTEAGVCNGHGTCLDGLSSPGTCQCDKGFQGDLCNECTANRSGPDCTCATGWDGPNCDRCAPGYYGSDCRQTCPGFGTEAGICGGHGVCNDNLDGDGSCKCDISHEKGGWKVDANGLCTECAPGWARDDEGQCNKCAYGYYGNTCTLECPGGIGNICNNQGTCDADGKCHCQDNVQGEDCSGCDGHFTGYPACNSCVYGWYDSDCSKPCPGGADNACNGHGTCDVNGRCTCNGHFKGTDCNECKDGFTGINCDKCLPGYAGPDCTPCPGGVNNVCNGHGTCSGELANTCVCSEGYAKDENGSCTKCAAGYQDNNGDGICLPDCSAKVCGSNAHCEDTSGEAICKCNSGYQDNDTNGSCLPTCATAGNCNGHGTCNDGSGEVVCSCANGYQGRYCDACATGYQDVNNDQTCEPNCDTANLSCQDNAHCFVNGTTGRVDCACDSGYQDNDGNGTCLPDCNTFGGCSNHGTCSIVSGSAKCACNPHWTGEHCAACESGYQDNDGNGSCEPACTSSTCNGHGTCSDSSGSAKCACNSHWAAPNCAACESGYQDNDGNGSCEPACTSSTCNSHGTCSDASGSVTCSCNSHWAAPNCAACESGYQDNDGNGTCLPDCNTFGGCSNHGTCSIVGGSAKCACNSHWAGEHCAACESGYQDNDGNGSCEPACTSATCNGHGTCSDSSGTAKCVSCNSNFDITTNCQYCLTGWQGANCDTKVSIVAPTISSSMPFENACHKDVVGWLNPAGSAMRVKFTHNNLNTAGYTFKCRSAPKSRISSASWIDAESGGYCKPSKDSSQPEGPYTTQIKAVYGAAESSVAEVSYYVSTSLNGVSCCSSSVSDATWFATAKNVLDTSAKFTSSNLTLPYVSVSGVSGESASPVTFRKKFTMNSDNTLLLLTRHTASGYAQRQSGSKNTCSPGMYAWLGQMWEVKGQHYYHCNEVKETRYNVYYDSHLHYNISTQCFWRYETTGDKYCKNYTYTFDGTDNYIWGERSWSYGAHHIVEKSTNECISAKEFNGLIVKNHINRSLTSCDAMVFNAHGDIACLYASGTSASVKKTVIHNHDYTLYNSVSFSKRGQLSPGFRILDNSDALTVSKGNNKGHVSLFSDKWCTYSSDYCEANIIPVLY